MKPKQRFIDAIHFKQPEDQIAFMELEFQIFEEYVGRDLILGYDFAKLSAKEKEHAHHTNAQTLIAMLQKAGHDAVKELGAYWEAAPGVPAYMWLPTMQDRLDFVKIFQQEANGAFYFLGNVGATLAIPEGDKLNDFVELLYDEPEQLQMQCEQQLLQGIEDGKKLMEAGCDGIINAADIAFNSGTFLSPDSLDTFFFPYLNRWVDAVKADGGITIWHTDGNINGVMPQTLASGVHAIQCVDPLGGMDIVALKKQVEGKLALIGNIDCSLLQSGTLEDIETQVKRVIEGCKGQGGGFVLSGCNAIFKGIPTKNYQHMVNCRTLYGKI